MKFGYEKDVKRVREYYASNFLEYGYSSKSLGWLKGKQNIRFAELTRFMDLSESFSILDIGCGFGDFVKYLNAKKDISDYSYHGIDLMDEMIEIAKKEFKNNDKISFEVGDFLEKHLVRKFDYVIASGVFNIRMVEDDNYDVVEKFLKKALDCCNDGGIVSFDFQSDKVDFFADNDVAFYNSPEKILSIAYKFSRRVMLNNLYMPFEYSVTVFKDDSFDKSKLLFTQYISDNIEEFENGAFQDDKPV